MKYRYTKYIFLRKKKVRPLLIQCTNIPPITWKQIFGKINYILKHYIDICYRYRHNNIVLLYGYMIDQPDVCLVYQLMANGSLEDRITCKVSNTILLISLLYI